MPNLVLTGFMGTGKTTVGKKVAKVLGLKFVDTDLDVEKVTGMTVKNIFKKYGEVRFRSEEKAAVKRVAKEENQVIATGGGVVLDPENISALKQNGVVVCLTATPEVIFERIKRKKSRPLLQVEDPLATIKQMLNDRQPFYTNAASSIDTSSRELNLVVADVVKIYKDFCQKGAESN